MNNGSSSILIDENLSRRLLPIVSELFHGSTHVAFEQLTNAQDLQIWEIAKNKGLCILTKDWDYKFMSIAFGCPPKVIRLNCGNKTTNYIIELLKSRFDIINTFIQEDDNCYLEIE